MIKKSSQLENAIINFRHQLQRNLHEIAKSIYIDLFPVISLIFIDFF